MGMLSTLLRVAVVILAVEERPGRRADGGSASVTTTLKSFASWLVAAAWEVGTPVERTMALSPISLTMPWKPLGGSSELGTAVGRPACTWTLWVSTTFIRAL